MAAAQPVRKPAERATALHARSALMPAPKPVLVLVRTLVPPGAGGLQRR
jgi:hypothetical protein